MKNEESNLGTRLSYLLIGGGIGTLLALLFAPKAGSEFRADIADTTRKGIDKTAVIANQLGEKAQTVSTSTSIKAGEIYDSAKETINSVTSVMTEIPENLQNAVHDKVVQISTSIEEGKKEYDRKSGFINDKS